MTEFSVIICTYNRAHLLPRTISSVLDQTFDDYEVVLVDDGSSDNTREVVAHRAHPKLRYVYRENGGLSAARNTGVANSSGRFVIPFDDDDEVLPTWLERLAAAARDDGCAVLTCGAVVADESGRITHTLLPEPLGPLFENAKAVFLPGTFAVRRDAYDAAGGYAEGLQVAHQTELALRLLPLCSSRGWSVRTVDEPLVRINKLRPERRPESTPRKRLSGTKYVLARHHELLSRHPETMADYLATAGVAAARLGDYREARRLLYRGVHTYPRQWRHYVRLAVALVPPVADIVWKSRSYRDQ
jgi:glycosyltransferase involved in cell wall biosynthesis